MDLFLYKVPQEEGKIEAVQLKQQPNNISYSFYNEHNTYKVYSFSCINSSETKHLKAKDK